MAKKNKKRNSNTNASKNNIDKNKFSFDDEIIIGVTKIPEKNIKKDTKKKKKKSKNKKNNSNIKKNVSIKKEIIEDDNKKQRRIKKFRIIKYASLLALIGVAIIATMFSPLFNIKEVTVKGNEKISENEIISLSEIEKGENTFKINKIKAIKNIKQNPYIESVQIKRNLPSEVEIIIQERKASFILEYGDNFVYINNQGYILEISSEKLDLPIIQGQATEDSCFIVGNRLINEDLQKLYTVIKIIEQAENNEIVNLITKIDIANKDNYKLVLEKERKTVYLGDCSNLSTRMLNVKAIIQKEKGIEGEIFVDMDLNTSYPMFRQKV